MSRPTPRTLRVVLAVVLASLVTAAPSAVVGQDDRHEAQHRSGGIEPTLRWLEQFGTSEADRATDLAIADSTVFVVGDTDGALPGQVALGGQDGFLAAYDIDGNLLWQRQFGTDDTDQPVAVAVVGSTVFVGGTTFGEFAVGSSVGSLDGFVAAFDLAGDQQWATQFGTSDFDTLYDIAATGGRVYAVGGTFGTFDTQIGLGSSDGFVVALDASGNQQWARQFGTSGFDEVTGAAISDGVVVAGTTDGAIPGQTNRGGRDGFLAHFDQSGDQSWARQFGTNGEDDVADLALADGRPIVSGRTFGQFPGQPDRGGSDAFVASFEPGGAPGWTTQFGSSGEDFALAVAEGEAGTLLVGGEAAEALPGQPTAGGGDGFIISLSEQGRILWSEPVGSDQIDVVHGVAFGAGLVFGVGESEGTLPDRASIGGTDAFVLALDGPPVMRCRGQVANVVGTSGDDDLTGTAGDDVMVGLGGDDKIAGRNGHDLICTGRGDDIALGGKGRDTIHGDRGDDKLRGGENGDVLTGGRGVDVVIGNGGPDSVWGDIDADRVNGGFGDDEVYGVEGNDRLVGSSGDDLLDGGAGDDKLLAGKGDDQLAGGPGRDILQGKEGDDDLDGGAGTDLCNGGPGSNSVTACERVT